MAYTRRQAEWKNYPDTTTPIRAEDLNAIEGGLVDAAGVADTALGLASSASSIATTAATTAAAAQDTADSAYSRASDALNLVGAPAGAAIDAHVGPTLAAGSGDQTAALNSFFASASPLGVKRLIGAFTVSGNISWSGSVYVDMYAATITQTASSTATLTPGAGSTIAGGTLVGKATDYAPGSTVPAANGISITAADVTVTGTKFVRHAGAGIKAFNSPRLRIDRVSVVGVGGVTTIPDLDAACYGIYIAGGCPDVTASSIDIADVSMGFIASSDTTGLSLSNVRIDRVPGQHGVYLQNGTNLRVDRIYAANCAYYGMKVQLNSAAVDHSYGTSISNITGKTLGAAVLSLNNIDTNMTTGKKFRGVNITNILGVDAASVLYLANVRGATVTGVAAENTTNAVVTILDVQDAEVSVVESRVSGREVVLFSNAAAVGSTGSATQRVALTRVRGYNPCNANSASFTGGVSIGGGSATDQANITLDGVAMHADNGAGANTFMRYGLVVNGTVPQETLRVRNFVSVGFTTNPASLASASKRLGEWANVDAGTTIANFPAGLLTRIGSLGNKTQWACNALPTNGVVQTGDTIHNTAPVAAGTPGWVATGAGGLHGGTWAATTAYAIVDWRRSTTTGRVFECTVAGTSGATEPAWNTAVVGDTFIDGGVTWVCRATGLGAVKAMASVAA